MREQMSRDEFWSRAVFPHDKAGNLVISSAMGRDEYEAECARVGIPSLSDQEIDQRDQRGWYSQGYALPQFGYTEETLAAYLRSVLDSARSWGVKVETGRYTVEGEYAAGARYRPTSRPKVAQVMPGTWASCDLCGMSVQRNMLLTSPCGNVCPDCYDEAEA